VAQVNGGLPGRISGNLHLYKGETRDSLQCETAPAPYAGKSYLYITGQGRKNALAPWLTGDFIMSNSDKNLIFEYYEDEIILSVIPSYAPLR